MAELSVAQRRALAVLAIGDRELRPVRTSNANVGQDKSHGMLRVHWQAAEWLLAHGLINPPSPVLRIVNLTEAGRALARELDL